MVTRSLAWSAAGSRSMEKAAASLCHFPKGIISHLRIRFGIAELIVFADENRGAEDGGPQAALVAHCRLRHVHRSHDLVGNAVDFFFFIERQIRVELHVQW